MSNDTTVIPPSTETFPETKKAPNSAEKENQCAQITAANTNTTSSSSATTSSSDSLDPPGESNGCKNINENIPTETTADNTRPTDHTAEDEKEMPNAGTDQHKDTVTSRRNKRRSSSRTPNNVTPSTDTNANSSSNQESAPAKKKSKLESSAISKENSSRKKKPSKKEQDLLDQAWICAACKEAECAMDPDADQFIVCDGPCRRLYHLPCAGLAQLPSEDTFWKCHDCLHKKHICGYCQEYGQDNTDVFKCQKTECGMFFHESCLQMQNIVIQYHDSGASGAADKTADSPSPEDEVENKPKILKFTCPCHWCWTCTQEDLKMEANAQQDGQSNNTSKKKKTKGRRGNKSNNKNNAFACKKETRLFQCLECPTSYHLTCIPPSAKFHELALLCHEHAEKHELPALDMEFAMQGSVEAQADQKLMKVQNHDNLLAKRQKAFRAKYASKNPFFPPGVVADKRTASEQTFLAKVAAKGFPTNESKDNDDEDEKRAASITTNQLIASGMATDRLLFCLPCDLQEEVYSKPPSYKHIHSLKYYPNKRPKKTPISQDMCSCVDSCGENCYNRLMYTECFGSKEAANGGQGRSTNCRIGPNCGNRRLGQRQCVKKCMTKREKGKGWGLITTDLVKTGQLVQEYLGDVIDEATKEERLNQWTKEHPNDPNFYIMCLSQGWYIDAREQSNLARFINHSCDPNCILLRFNVGGYMRNGIFALQDIKPGEFLSYDYHFDTQHGDKFVCRCGSVNCRGTMKEKNVKKEDTKKTKAQLWEQAKQQLDKDKQFLDEMEARRKWNSTIQAVLPGTGIPSDPHADSGHASKQGKASGSAGGNGSNTKKVEWVSNGVQDKYRSTAYGNRVFLWRNAIKGSDFASRWERSQKKRINKCSTAAKKVHEDVLSVIARSNQSS